jgi:hypothetical protein
LLIFAFSSPPSREDFKRSKEWEGY